MIASSLFLWGSGLSGHCFFQAFLHTIYDLRNSLVTPARTGWGLSYPKFLGDLRPRSREWPERPSRENTSFMLPLLPHYEHHCRADFTDHELEASCTLGLCLTFWSQVPSSRSEKGCTLVVGDTWIQALTASSEISFCF